MTGVLRQHWFARRLLLVYEKTIRLALGVFCAATKKPTTNDFNQPHHRTRQCNKEETLDDTTQSETLRISGDASACLDSFALAICKLLRTIFCKGVCQSFVRVWHSQHHNHKFAAVVRARHRTWDYASDASSFKQALSQQKRSQSPHISYVSCKFE